MPNSDQITGRRNKSRTGNSNGTMPTASSSKRRRHDSPRSTDARNESVPACRPAKRARAARGSSDGDQASSSARVDSATIDGDGAFATRASILSLPDTVLAHVFELMPFRVGRVDGVNWGWRGLDCELALCVPLVCRRFRRVCRELVRLDCFTLYWIAHHQAALHGRELGVDMCRRVTSRVVELLIRRFRDVTSVDFDYCLATPPSTYSAVARCCPNLRFLNAETDGDMGDAELAALGAGCPKLRRVRFAGPSLKVTSQGLAALARGCRVLERVELSTCAALGDEGLAALALSCPRLQHLNVAWAGGVTDAGVAAVARGCPRLTHLDLMGLSRVTDAALADVGHGCPLLSYVNLAACVLVTDAGVRAMVDACPSLRGRAEGGGHAGSETDRGGGGATASVLPAEESTAVEPARRRVVLWKADPDYPIPGVTGDAIANLVANYPGLDVD